QALPVELVHALASLVARVLEREAGGDDVGRVEAGTQAPQVYERPDEQPGSDQKIDSQSDLTAREQRHRDEPLAGGQPASAGLCRAEIHAAGVEGRKESKEDGGEKRKESRGGQDARVEGDAAQEAEACFSDSFESLERRKTDGDSCCSAEEG